MRVHPAHRICYGLPMKNEIELTVIMPCLNEAETIERCIQKAQRYFERAGIRGEVVVGDNGSTDGSQEIALRNGARLVEVPVRGYGAALYQATLAARGQYVIMGDSDDSYDFGDLTAFVNKLREGYDLVMGNRFAGGIHPGAMPFKNRYLGNPALTGIGRLLFGATVHDFHCGIRGFSIEAFHRMDLRTTGMEYASEMVIKATLAKMRVCEVPTQLHKDGRSRPPHLRPWRDGWRHLRFMLLYSPDWLFLIPGICAMLVGSILGLRLWMGTIVLGTIGFDVHSLVYAAFLTLLGFHAILFSVFAKTYTSHMGLLPAPPWLTRAHRHIDLETGILTGFLLIFGGIAGIVVAVLGWRETGYGALAPQQALRVVVPSGLLLTLGGEVLLGSFLLSVLGLGIRREIPPVVERQSRPDD